MNRKVTKVFFYGLFTDETLLRTQGIQTIKGEKGFVSGYGLRIGERALLVESPAEKVYGVAFSLNTLDIEQLYSKVSVKDYKPIVVPFTSYETGTTGPVNCYNLPASRLCGTSPEYTKKNSGATSIIEIPSNVCCYDCNFC